jgi:hypothetical protein
LFAGKQGDTIFPHWVIVNFEQFFEHYIYI